MYNVVRVPYDKWGTTKLNYVHIMPRRVTVLHTNPMRPLGSSELSLQPFQLRNCNIDDILFCLALL